MKELTINLGTKSNEIEIVPLGDLHIGDPNCNIDLIKQTIDYIANTKNCYCILNGDLMNNALKTSKSDSYLETMPMEEQQEKLVELLYPIKDKILMLAQGNHEYRSSLLCGIDPLRYVARSLGLLEKGRYCTGAYLLTLLFGKRNGTDKLTNAYVVFGIHGGSGGGRRAGSTANALEDMNKIIPNADLYLHSHTHTQILYPDSIFIYNNTSKTLQRHYRTYYNTNSFLEYGGYAEMKGYKPTDTYPNVLRIRIIRDGGKMRKLTDVIRL